MDRRTALRVIGWSAVGPGLVLAGCADMDAPPEPPGLAAGGDYRLGAGDAVRITVFGEQPLSGEFRVDGSGRIAMPLIGEVPAKDRTTRELEREIARRLSPAYVRDAKVAAEVLTFRPFFILGEVRTPGQYPYVSGMTALSAVAMAGGFTYRARQDVVFVSRGRDPERKVYKAPITTPVMPDDVVRIAERYF
ncbi:polysaccharide biosynthesis/export family protein [Azospirillum sp.]|uniref:polysaccharide biosynthesis/export family protein n=1 Tax=Azospirillum sp. TaxID=34012 RepID=UPI002D73ED35|nr:polysaccharide biosynthesis/export family protein [Azospirillum sp.]HYD65711.1 polysaccharide biosynthesis/export family protein [Azospirillum sp.]